MSYFEKKRSKNVILTSRIVEWPQSKKTKLFDIFLNIIVHLYKYLWRIFLSGNLYETVCKHVEYCSLDDYRQQFDLISCAEPSAACCFRRCFTFIFRIIILIEQDKYAYVIQLMCKNWNVARPTGELGNSAEIYLFYVSSQDDKPKEILGTVLLQYLTIKKIHSFDFI